MATFKTLKVDRTGPVVVVALNRPDYSNSITVELRSELIAAVEEISADHSIRSVVLTSEGEDAFSVGMDVVELSELPAAEIQEVGGAARRLHEALTQLPVPVIAAIKGACLGAGFELALHCDVRLARVDARFGLPGINVGLNPGGGALGRLQRMSGYGSAAALSLTGGVITADRAFMLGMVSNVASAAEFWPSVEQLAMHLAGLSPVAVAETKRLLDAAMNSTHAAQDLSPAALARCFSEGDARARLQMMFAGRDPEATVH